MRKISLAALKAFNGRYNFSKSNTRVDVNEGSVFLYLHGNLIARKPKGEAIEITTAGWDTPTTKERLNAFAGVRLTTRKGTLFLNDTEWDGSWITI